MPIFCGPRSENNRHKLHAHRTVSNAIDTKYEVYSTSQSEKYVSEVGWNESYSK